MEPFRCRGGSLALDEVRLIGFGTWDWWTVGGRYEGWLGGKNIIGVSELCHALSQGEVEHPFALVTPDALWYDEETYDCDSWEAEVLKILDEYADCSAVA